MEKAIDSEVSIELTVDASGSTCKKKSIFSRWQCSSVKRRWRSFRIFM